jgi:hypothetical protein
MVIEQCMLVAVHDPQELPCVASPPVPASERKDHPLTVSEVPFPEAVKLALSPDASDVFDAVRVSSAGRTVTAADAESFEVVYAHIIPVAGGENAQMPLLIDTHGLPTAAPLAGRHTHRDAAPSTPSSFGVKLTIAPGGTALLSALSAKFV